MDKALRVILPIDMPTEEEWVRYENKVFDKYKVGRKIIKVLHEKNNSPVKSSEIHELSAQVVHIMNLVLRNKKQRHRVRAQIMGGSGGVYNNFYLKHDPDREWKPEDAL